MPRRRYARRRPLRRPRKVRRVRRVRRVPRAPRSQSIYVKEKFIYSGGDLSTNGGAVPLITMAMIPGIANYQALYSNYRLCALRFAFISNYGVAEYNQAVYSNASSVPYSGQHRLTIVRSRQDPTPMASEADAIAYNNCLITTIDNRRTPFTFYVKRPMFQVSGAVSGTMYDNRVMDLSITTTPFLSCKWWMASEATGTYPYRVFVTAYIQFLNPKS